MRTRHTPSMGACSNSRWNCSGKQALAGVWRSPTRLRQSRRTGPTRSCRAYGSDSIVGLDLEAQQFRLQDTLRTLRALSTNDLVRLPTSMWMDGAIEFK